LYKIHSEISNFIKDGGTVMSELDIDTIQDNIHVKGIIDIVAIDKEGNVHIYDLKVSKNNYENWDQVKTLSTDWQLAFYRGLLGQYIDVKSATLNIIPIKTGAVYTADSGTKQILATNLNYAGQVPLLQYELKGLRENGKLTKVVNALIPQKIQIPYDPAKSKKFTSDLSLLIPKYEIKTSSSEYNVERIVEAAIRNKKFDIFNNFPEILSEELEKNLMAIGFSEDKNSNIFKFD
jgi:hypothetical protein